MTDEPRGDVLPHWPRHEVVLPSGVVSVRSAPATGDPVDQAVFVHGLGGSATNWTDLMGLLADQVEGVALDLPGFGWSPPPPGRDYSLRRHAHVVAELLESRGEPVHLFGNSLGGAVSLVVAGTRPELLRSLTLVAPALPVLRPRRTNAHLPALALPFAGQRLARRLGRFPVEQRVRATLELCYADPSRVPAPRLAAAMEEAERRAHLDHDGDAMLLTLRSLMSAYLRPTAWPLWRLAAHVEAPVLLVYGLQDKLVDPRTATRAARSFPSAELVMVPDCGHLAQIEHPGLVAGAVRRFLERARRRADR